MQSIGVHFIQPLLRFEDRRVVHESPNRPARRRLLEQAHNIRLFRYISNT